MFRREIQQGTSCFHNLWILISTKFLDSRRYFKIYFYYSLGESYSERPPNAPKPRPDGPCHLPDAGPAFGAITKRSPLPPTLFCCQLPPATASPLPSAARPLPWRNSQPPPQPPSGRSSWTSTTPTSTSTLHPHRPSRAPAPPHPPTTTRTNPRTPPTTTASPSRPPPSRIRCDAASTTDRLSL